MPRSYKWSLSFRFPHRKLVYATLLPYTCYMPRQSHSSRFNRRKMLSEYRITNLLTPWCRLLLEKLTGLQLVKKFSAYHGTRRFITALTSVRHLSLSWASPIQSIYPHPTSCRSILILSTHLRLGLPSGLLPWHTPANSGSTKICCYSVTCLFLNATKLT